MRTMPSAASANMPPRLRPMIVYAANWVMSGSSPSRAVPSAERRPGAAWSVVGRVREASIRVMSARAVGERHRPAGLEVLDSVQGLDGRGLRQVRAGGPGRGDEHHCRRPRVLRVDVQGLELARREVLDGAQVLT